MRISTSVAALSLASTALAQLSPIALGETLLNFLTPNCQATVLELVNGTSPISECLNVQSLLPILLSNGSIIPGIDAYLETTCIGAPCSNETLVNATQTILTGCATDIASLGLSNTTLTEIGEYIVSGYPVAREVACLKTSTPYNATNASIPITNATYNLTNGTFCATSLLTELSSFLGANLTDTYVETALLGGNATTVQLLKEIPYSTLCSDCIFAAADLIEESYPFLGNYSISNNVTIVQLLDGTCNAAGFNVTSNGTLPSTISEIAVNSTYSYNVTAGNFTYTPASPVAGNVTAVKKRWLGQ
ncbi:hypothetical protein P7C73_g3688, partial [Tremellales sp. Uapishka_1]